MIQLSLVMILWGTLGIFVLWSQLPAMDIAFYRCLIGALVMGLWMIRSRQHMVINKKTVTTAIAGIFLVLNWIFLFKSFKVSSITIGNMSYYLQPIILIILGIFFHQEKVSPRKWFLILLALAGVLLTLDFRNVGSSHILQGFFLAILAALLYSVVTLLMKKIDFNYFWIIFIQLTVGVIILLPFFHFHPLTLIQTGCLFVMGIFHTVLAYFLYYNAIKKTSFIQIAVLSYLDPVVAIATDMVFFSRRLNGYQLSGILLTFLALYFLVIIYRSNVQVEEVAT